VLLGQRATHWLCVARLRDASQFVSKMKIITNSNLRSHFALTTFTMCCLF